MAGPNPCGTVSILNYVELALSIIIGVMIADLTCFGCYFSENQFIDGMVYGFLIVNIVVVMAICIRVDIHGKVMLCITGIGMFMFLVITILILVDLIQNKKDSNDWIDVTRQVIAFCASAVLCVIYVFDFIVNYKKVRP